MTKHFCLMIIFAYSWHISLAQESTFSKKHFDLIQKELKTEMTKLPPAIDIYDSLHTSLKIAVEKFDSTEIVLRDLQYSLDSSSGEDKAVIISTIDSLSRNQEIWYYFKDSLTRRINDLEIRSSRTVSVPAALRTRDKMQRRAAMQSGSNVTASDSTHTRSSLDQTSNLISNSFKLSIAVLIFGLIIIVGVMFIMFKQNKPWNSNSIQMVGLIMVVTASIFLMTAGYSTKQVTPVIGLLGTIVGFLLGKTNSPDQKGGDGD